MVDVDLEKFFDRVNHDILMARLARRVADKRLLRIVRRFLEAGLMQDGVCVARPEGTPQGGPLSPLLANLLLDDLDKELERRGHRFCRYADDCNIYVQSQAAGERVRVRVGDSVPGKDAAFSASIGRKSEVAFVEERKFPRPPTPGEAGSSASLRRVWNEARDRIRGCSRGAQPRNRFVRDDRRAQFLPDRLGDLLPPRGVQEPPDGTGRLGPPEAALRSSGSLQSQGDSQHHRGLS